MDVHQQVELLLAGFGERGVDANAGVVHQRIEAVALPGGAEGQAHPLGEVGERGATTYIQLQGDGLATQRTNLRHHRIGLGLVAVVGEDQVMAVASQMQGSVLAQAAARAGNEVSLFMGNTSSDESG